MVCLRLHAGCSAHDSKGWHLALHLDCLCASLQGEVPLLRTACLVLDPAMQPARLQCTRDRHQSARVSGPGRKAESGIACLLVNSPPACHSAAWRLRLKLCGVETSGALERDRVRWYTSVAPTGVDSRCKLQGLPQIVTQLERSPNAGIAVIQNSHCLCVKWMRAAIMCRSIHSSREHERAYGCTCQDVRPDA